MSLIEIQSASVTYSGRPVLDGIDVRIGEGEFVCVLGETGCGKSTFLRLVLGSEKPGSGRVLIDGAEHCRPDPTRGYVPQKYALFPDKTVLDNIMFGPAMTEYNLLTRLSPGYMRRRRQLKAEAVEYLIRIGMRPQDGSKYPHQLSGGMQQRVAIAQALINHPRILLMDEAFSALDPGTRRDMQDLIKKLWQDTGVTVLFVTHNIPEALRLGTRVVVLAKESPDQGSRVAFDIAVPQPCRGEDVRRLVFQLEVASGANREPDPVEHETYVGEAVQRSVLGA